MQTIDITGQRFGRLVVIEQLPERRRKHIVWRCKCDCGNYSDVLGYSLRYGTTQSCGCLETENKERILGQHKKHEFSKDPNLRHIYNVWKSMRGRCNRRTDKRYHRYGERGISICEEWKDPTVFVDWAIAHGYQRGLTLDRINNDGNYCPENCRFVPVKVNNRNSSNTHLHIDEVEQIRKEYRSTHRRQVDIASDYGVTQQTVSRIVNKKSWL